MIQQAKLFVRYDAANTLDQIKSKTDDYNSSLDRLNSNTHSFVQACAVTTFSYLLMRDIKKSTPEESTSDIKYVFFLSASTLLCVVGAVRACWNMRSCLETRSECIRKHDLLNDTIANLSSQ